MMTDTQYRYPDDAVMHFKEKEVSATAKGVARPVLAAKGPGRKGAKQLRKTRTKPGLSLTDADGNAKPSKFSSTLVGGWSHASDESDDDDDEDDVEISLPVIKDDSADEDYHEEGSMSPSQASGLATPERGQARRGRKSRKRKASSEDDFWGYVH